jgi:hypothetical protein
VASAQEDVAEAEFEDLVHMLNVNLSSHKHHRLKQAKLAEMIDTPLVDPPVSLEPIPIESISCPVVPLLEPPPRVDPLEEERKRFGKYWDESFQWDLISKRVAEVKM